MKKILIQNYSIFICIIYGVALILLSDNGTTEEFYFLIALGTIMSFVGIIGLIQLMKENDTNKFKQKSK